MNPKAEERPPIAESASDHAAGRRSDPRRCRPLAALLVALALWRFVGLDSFDLEKDGALWSLRAKACALRGDWWDQTPHSIGGLHTSAYPPLHVWATGASYRLFGINGFAARFPGALAGFALVAAVTAMGWLAGGPWTGVLAGILVAGNRRIFGYSQNAQLEATYLAWNTIALLTYAARVRFLGERRQLSTVCLVAAGVAFGCALMSKIATGFLVGLVLAPWGLYLLYARQITLGRLLLDGLIVLAIGLAIALPWHVSMLLKYRVGPDLFTDNAFVKMFWEYHILERSRIPIEGHSPGAWGNLFYLHAGVVAMPFITACAIAGLASALRGAARRRPIEWAVSMRALFAVFFIVNFIVITRAATKMNSYAVTLIVPGALLAGAFLSGLFSRRARGWTIFALLAGTFMAVLYSQTNAIQRAIPAFLAQAATDGHSRGLLVFLAQAAGACAIAGAFCALARKRGVREIVLACVVIAPLCAIAFAVPFSHEQKDWTRIEREIGIFENVRSVIVLGYWRDNRQIDYYLHGADMGFYPELLYVHVQHQDGQLEGWTVREGVRKHHELLAEKEAQALIGEALARGETVAVLFADHGLPAAVTSAAETRLPKRAESKRITLLAGDGNQQGG